MQGICLDGLQSQIQNLFQKGPAFIHTCAAYSELPVHINTMIENNVFQFNNCTCLRKIVTSIVFKTLQIIWLHRLHLRLFKFTVQKLIPIIAKWRNRDLYFFSSKQLKDKVVWTTMTICIYFFNWDKGSKEII